ncbi:MAG: hypothetical protein IPI67_05730 [Myxococcales bacterium]|nr:hypothetical protein [Myxococcales bacterium]
MTARQRALALAKVAARLAKVTARQRALALEKVTARQRAPALAKVTARAGSGERAGRTRPAR